MNCRIIHYFFNSNYYTRPIQTPRKSTVTDDYKFSIEIDRVHIYISKIFGYYLSIGIFLY